MIVYVNNQSMELAVPVSVATLLQTAGLKEQRGVAVALNNAVVAHSTWKDVFVKESDRITIIKATQGG